MPSIQKSFNEQSRLYLDDLSSGIRSDISPLNIPLGGAQTGTTNLIWLNGFLRPRAGMGTTFAVSEPQLNLGEVRAMPIYRTYSSPEYTDKLSRVRKQTSGGIYVFETEVSRNPQVWSIPTTTVGAFSAPRNYPHITWANFRGDLFIAGFNELLKFNPSTGVTFVHSAQPVGALKPPQSPGIVVAGDSRLFLADCYDQFETANVPGRLYWSDSLLPHVWNGGEGSGSSGYMDLPRNNRSITGLIVSSAGLVAFTDREMYLGYFVGMPKVYEFRGVTNGVGCVSHETIRPYRDGSYIWLGGDNVYIGVPGQMPVAIGDKIRNRLREIAVESRLREAFASIDIEQNLYHLYLPGSGSSSGLVKCLTCNIRSGSWWEADLSQSMKCTSEISLGPWDNRLLLGTTDCRCLELSYSTATDAGTVYPTTFKTGVIAVKTVFGQAAEIADFQWARVHATQEGLTSQELGFRFFGSIGLDNWLSDTAIQKQTVDGTPDHVYASGRRSGENLYLELFTLDARQFPASSRIDLGMIPQGGTR